MYVGGVLTFMEIDSFGSDADRSSSNSRASIAKSGAFTTLALVSLCCQYCWSTWQKIVPISNPARIVPCFVGRTIWYLTKMVWYESFCIFRSASSSDVPSRPPVRELFFSAIFFSHPPKPNNLSHSSVPSFYPHTGSGHWTQDNLNVKTKHNGFDHIAYI